MVRVTWVRKEKSFLGVSGWAGVDSCGFGRGKKGGREIWRKGGEVARVCVCVTSADRREICVRKG